MKSFPFLRDTKSAFCRRSKPELSLIAYNDRDRVGGEGAGEGHYDIAKQAWRTVGERLGSSVGVEPILALALT